MKGTSKQKKQVIKFIRSNIYNRKIINCKFLDRVWAYKFSKIDFQFYSLSKIIPPLQGIRNIIIKQLEVNPPITPLILSRVQHNFKTKTNFDQTRSQLNIIMEDRFKYNYIRGSCHPLKVSSPDHVLVKGIFSIKLLKILFEGKVIVNYDESSFDRDVIRNYSKLLKVQQKRF